MAGKVKVDLGFAVLTAEKNEDPMYPEIFVGLENSNGCWIQDLVIVGGKYHYQDGKIVYDEEVSVKVYSDKDSEDYTHDFTVGVYHEPDEGGAV